jgi:GNAT superfamily N-acetyltransferase
MTIAAPPYAMRAMLPSDAPFIFTSWTQWARKSAKWLRFLSDRVFYDAHGGYRAHVEHLLKTSRVLVACDTETPEFVLGYVVVGANTASLDIVHMVYVERSFRRMGVALDLLRAAVTGFGSRDITCTMNRPAWPAFAARWRLRFDPFAAGIAGERFKAWAAQWRESCVVECAAPVIPDVGAQIAERAEQIAQQIAREAK